MRHLSARALTWGFIVLLGIASALPNVLPDSTLERLPDWYAANQLTLGLDLRGGSYLLLGVNVDELLLDRNQQAANELAARLQQAGIRHGLPLVEASGVDFTLRDASQLDMASRIARELLLEKSSEQPAYAIDTVRATQALQLRVRAPYIDATVDDAVTQSLDVVRRRLDESGLVEPGISRQGRDRIEVQLPGISEPQRIRELLGTTAKMDFHWLAARNEAAAITLPGALAGESYQLERQVAMEGRHVRDARMAFDPNTTEPKVTFRLDTEGARLFADMTQANVGRRLAVVLDGKVVTAPVIRTAIAGGSGEISGNFRRSEAADLAVLLRAGALPAELVVLQERTVGPNLGSDAIRMGLISGLAGAALVLACMTLVYGRWGLIAWLGLCVNVSLIFAVLSLLRGTLTLPGIAGIILGIGMAVDANILINERIREESHAGKSARQALAEGFRKAWAAILDSNVTTLIAISMLITIGSGPVRGFATTIGIGLLTSLITVMGVTRLVMEAQVRGKMRNKGREPLQFGGLNLVERLAANLGPDGRVIDFMRAGTAGLLLSAVLSIASVVLMLTPGMHYGIDFSGGALLEVHTASAAIEDLRAGLANAGLTGASLQEFGTAQDFQLRMSLPDDGEKSAVVIDAIKSAVQAVAPDAEFPRAEVVGPRVSGDFADLSIVAVLAAGLGMLAYLWMRFENHFALAAVLTIALDLTKTIGFFVLTGVEFNLTAVAALLALIGYSVNDKVIVFDRVRENLKQQPGEALESILNRSISTTLTRTLLTSGSTFLALLPMAIFGGSAVESFAWPLLIGIVVGTSSSIFIAAPILLRLGRRRARLGLPQLAQELSADDEALVPERP